MSAGSVIAAMTLTVPPQRGNCVAYCITSNSFLNWLNEQPILRVVST